MVGAEQKKFGPAPREVRAAFPPHKLMSKEIVITQPIRGEAAVATPEVRLRQPRAAKAAVAATPSGSVGQRRRLDDSSGNLPCR